MAGDPQGFCLWLEGATSAISRGCFSDPFAVDLGVKQAQTNRQGLGKSSMFPISLPEGAWAPH